MNRTPSHSDFLTHFHTCVYTTLWLKVSQRVSHEKHVHPHVITCLSVVISPCFDLFLSLFCVSTFCPFSTPPLFCSSSSMWSKPPSIEPNAHTQNEEYCSVAIHNRLTGHEPKQLDNSDNSETYAVIFQNESVDIDTEPSYPCDAELDDEIIGKALSSPLFFLEREEPADRRQASLSHDESLSSARSFFAHARTGRPVHELGSCQKRKSSRDQENERMRILLERQKRANPL